jgi:RHS repeat-associated protein
MKKNGTTTEKYFIWNQRSQLIGVADGSGILAASFVYGSKAHVPDYMITSTAEYQIVSNHLGSPVSVLNKSTGVIAQEIKYDEFGNVTSDTNPGFTPFGFAGCLYDVETKLCRFGARDYDASVGRWLSKDPILFGGGDTNLYGYVLQDPINLIDPSGLFPSSGAGQIFMPNIYDITRNPPKSIQSRIQDMLRIGQEQDKLIAQRNLLDPSNPLHRIQLQQLNRREGELFDRLLDEMNIFNNLKEPRKECQL